MRNKNRFVQFDTFFNRDDTSSFPIADDSCRKQKRAISS